MNKPSDFLIRQVFYNTAEYQDVLRLRALAYSRDLAGQNELVDEYSHHFAAFKESKIVGALRVTCRIHGPIESENAFPDWLLQEFSNSICSASRMCINPAMGTRSGIPTALTRFAWQTVLPLGIRIDVSKARFNAIPYYLRMGYCFVKDSAFDFERWNLRCGVIAHPASPDHLSPLSDIFSSISNPFDIRNDLYRDRFLYRYKDFAQYRDTLPAIRTTNE